MQKEEHFNTDLIMKEYFEKHHDKHLEEVLRRDTVQGRMDEALEESDGTAADGFFRFFDNEIRRAAAHMGICLIYMPDFGVLKERNKKGKIIIEIDSRDNGWTLVKDCFELQLSKKTALRNVKMQILQRPPRTPWASCDDSVCRYYNMLVKWDDAFPLVQRVLFSSLFRQRFLMTMESRVLGSMTTQRFMSNIGQVFSFRSCALKE